MKRVPPTGPLNANIAVVGEGPGKEELKQGEPFVGSSGREQDKLLKAAGLDRSEIYITNVTKVYPDGPKKKFFFNPDGSPTQEYMQGILELLEELKEVQPNVAVAVGNYSLWALTQNWGITNWRGSIIESTLLPGLKVIPTIHPAWFLRTRQWHRFPLSEWDWQRIAAQSAFPEIKRRPRNVVVNPTPEEIEYAKERLREAELITIDSEWYSPNKMAYPGFSDCPEWAITIPLDSTFNFRAIKDICSFPNPKVMQNAMFDVVAAARLGIEITNVKHDTMVMWNACWGDLRDKKLQTIVSVLTDIPYYKSDVEFVGSDDDKGQEYCGIDCMGTHESAEKILDSEFQISGGKKGYEISMSVMDTFLRASKIGILADRKKLRELAKMHEEEANRLEAKLGEIVGKPFNCRSYKQVQEVVFDILKLGGGRKRTSKQETLMDIAGSMDPGEDQDILTDIIWVRRHRNIVSRYLTEEKVVDDDGRIRCTWNIAGTRNGRLSTTTPWWPGVPLQTVPLYPFNAREVYIPDPGYVFIGWDLAQAEARVVAAITGDFELLDDMDRGVDIHLKLASQLPFNRSLEELELMKEEEGKEFPERILAKTTRHAKNYKQSWMGLKTTVNKDFIDTRVGINAKTAKVLDAAYMDLHPGLEVWWDEVYRAVRDQSYLVNPYGRRRNFLGRMSYGDQLHRDAIAFEPQSAVADCTTMAIAEIDQHDWIQPMAHMHDGGFVQVPEDRAEEAEEIIKKATTREMVVRKTVLTIPSETKISASSWGDL